MIAVNYLKNPDALISQLELDLAGVIGATEPQREAFWRWLLATAAPVARAVRAAPEWVKEARAAAQALAKSVRLALQGIFNGCF